MSARYVPMIDWDGRQIAEFAIHDLPAGVVALDVDAPTDFYEEGPGIELIVKGVRALAANLSQEHHLGLFWLYFTGNGMHVLFERLLPGGCQMALHAMCDARERFTGWRECSGHLGHCTDADAVQLRVGCKPGRPWDITSVPGNPPVSGGPAHVQEHAHLLALQLPAR